MSAEHQHPRAGARRLFGAASLIAGGNVASRLLGLVREQVIAGYFATTLEASALRAALRVPTMIYDLLIGGMLSAALVPVLSSYATTRRAELWRAVSVLLSTVAALTGLVALGLYAFAGPIARVLAGGFPPEGVAIVARSLRWLSPAVVMFGVAGTITGALYALERFSRPAAAGALYNLALIATLVLFRDRLGIYALPLGVTVGSVAQVLLLAPGLSDARLGVVFDLHHPAVRRVLVLYFPVALGLVVTQAQVWVDTRLASQAGAAALSVMGYATNLIQFPHGLVAVAVSIAILPALSATHARGEAPAFAHTLARGARAVVALTLPACVGLAVLAHPIVGTVFQHGAFGIADREIVVVALYGYLVGLPFAALDWPLNYAFYARQDTWTPALVGMLSVGAYLAVALLLGPTLNVAGLPADRLFLGLVLADSVKQATHLCAMLVLTCRVIGRDALAHLGRTSVAAGAAALVMALAVVLVDHAASAALGAGTAGLALRGALGVLAGAAVYLPLAARLGVTEVSWLIGAVRERMRPA